MSLQQFKVLTFDVVGTLIDFERGMLDFLRRAVPHNDVSDDAFLAAYRQARKRAGTLAYPDDLEPVWHLIAPPLGLPDTPELARGFRDSVAAWPAFPDSVAALKRLKSRFKLVTMTNAQAWALAHKGEFEAGRDLFNLVADKNKPEVLNGLGYTNRKLGNFDEGIAYYKKALALDPNYAEAREYLGEGYVTMGKLDLAKEQLAEIHRICGGTSCEEYAELNEAIEQAVKAAEASSP